MKYSVIIPAYNAEKTIERCLRSLVTQEYPDAEIILINDGSTDRSGELCQEFADRYDQIRYIAKENGGVSAARNTGLDVAQGEYVLFADSDDYVSSDYFTALDTISDVWDYVMFSYYVVNGDQMQERILTDSFSSDTQDYFVKLCDFICRKKMNCPWSKRFRREIIQTNHIRFHEQLSVGEDALFNLRYAVCCNSCWLTSQPLYYVSVENEQSLSRKPRSDVREQLSVGERDMMHAIHAAKITESDWEVLFSAMNFLQVSEIYSEAKRMHLSRKKTLLRIREIRRMCDVLNRQHLDLPDSRYCKLLSLPVKLRLAFLIDLVGWKLSR